MVINRSIASLVAAVSVACAALGMTGAAQAQNVNWSVGVSSPGVQLGLTNAQPIYIQQPMYQPVYVTPRPVYLAPRPVIYGPPPVYMAQPQYVQIGWDRPGHGYGWRNGHGRHEESRYEGNRFEGERGGHWRQDHRRD